MIMKDQISWHPGTMPLKIRIDTHFGVDVNYYRSLKGKKLALEEIYESWEETYSLLTSFVVQLLGVDLRARTYLVREANGSFLSFLGF